MKKNPLTSKERRGLLAVAAAALLCIASGFIFRNCSSLTVDRSLSSESDLREYPVSTDSIVSRPKGKKSSKKKKQKAKRRPVKKIYPERDPLSQPCD